MAEYRPSALLIALLLAVAFWPALIFWPEMLPAAIAILLTVATEP